MPHPKSALELAQRKERKTRFEHDLAIRHRACTNQAWRVEASARGNELAIHLNCIVTTSALQHNTITIKADQFHITARSIATQKKIDSHGSSAITADNSIHLNVNTGWGRADNLKALAAEVGIDERQKLHYEVKTKQGYNNAYMRSLVKEFRAKVAVRIRQYLGGSVVVKWEGDKTFPTA
ncbi:hypothetical protein J3R83DRAFT_119 [Lanmaoa asiatica]|nr:hypothetical protein J3R83DRAFT_119 [Lanmaoa asiatica]